MKDKQENYIETIKKNINFFYIHIIATAIALCSPNNDLWFLISSGRVVQNFGFITKEMLTFHTNFDIIVQQWPVALLFSFLYDTFGMLGVIIVVSFTACIIAFLIFKIINLICKNKQLSIVYTAILFVFFSLFITTRPYVFSTVFLLLFIYGLEAYIATNNKKYLYLLPLASVLLINFHASIWFMLFVLFLPYLVDMIQIPFIKTRYYIHDKYNKKPVFIAILLMFFMGIINPYGTKAMFYVFKSYGIPEISNYVSEMKALFYSPYAWNFIIISFVLVVFVFFTRAITKTKNFKLRYIYMVLGTFIMLLLNRRNLIFFIIGIVCELGYCLKSINSVEVSSRNCKKNYLLNFIIYIFIFVHGVMGGISYHSLLNTTPEYEKIFNYIKQYQESNIVLYTDYNTGGHAEFYGFHPFIDPRAEVFLKANNNCEDVYIEYINLISNKSSYEDFMNKYRFTHLIVENNNDKYMKKHLMQDERYEAVVEDDGYILYQIKKY